MRHTLTNIGKFLRDKVSSWNKITVLSGEKKRGLLVRDRGDAYIVPLSWAATTVECPYVNLGDGLSPIMVSALSGIPCVHRGFDSYTERMACVGTIGHQLKHGTIHFWGTGVSRSSNAVDREIKRYLRPPNTEFRVHALRGPFSAKTFQAEGIEVPDVYGDPIWFLPSIVEPAPEKKYELGVIVHLAELTEKTDTAPTKPKFTRYQVPEDLASSVRIISTMTQPNFASMEEKIKEITACKRIASTSLHGLVIAEAYKIPCVYFQTRGGKASFQRLDDENVYIDGRMRDFYSGVGMEKIFLYGQWRPRQTNWEDLIQAIDTYWQPLEWSGESFLETFPLPLTFNPLQQTYGPDRTLFNKIKL